MERLKSRKKNQISSEISSSETSDDDDDCGDSFEAGGSPSCIPLKGYSKYEKHGNNQQGQAHVQRVHEELCDINKKVQKESKRLKDWDLQLQVREKRLDEIEKELSAYAGSMKETIEKEILKRHEEIEKEYESKVQLLQEETKKSRNSFRSIKKANETLKSKIAEDEYKLKCYEEKQSSLQSRITNLQRKIELLNKQISEQAIEHKNSLMEKIKTTKNNKDQSSSSISHTLFETFSLLLHWIADVHLKANVNCIMKSGHQLHTKEWDVDVQLVNDRALKIIMFMPNILQQASMNDKLQLPFVQFLYWSMLHLGITHCMQRLSHSATYRRIGEELFHADRPKQNKENLISKAFYRNTNYNIKILSCLIILQSVTQADILVQVLQMLNKELKHELSKECFLEHHGTEMLLLLFKPSNNIHLGYATEILMTLVIDSPYTQQFLNALCTVEWIQSIISILKASSGDVTLMENLSLILQRISKVKSVKPIFDALQIKRCVTELLQLPTCEGEYLQLNLRSILLNIEAMRTKKEK